MKYFIENNKPILFKVLSIIGFLLIIFLTFYKLDVSSIKDWDEARHGVNAYELLKNDNWLITTYGYKNDYWNLKPPLSEWLIILGYKIFGFNTLGLRIYSALSHLITVIICFSFSKKYLGKLSAIFTLYAFVAWKTFYGSHYVRYGDADSFFIMLYVIATLSLCMIEKNKKFLYLACFCCALSFLAKATHAGIFVVCIFIVIFGSSFIKKLTIKEILTCFIFAVTPIAIWAVSRYIADGPKFLEQMIFYDVIARSTKTIEGHVGGPLFYVRQFFNSKFAFVIFPFLMSFIILCKKYDIKKINLKPCIIAILIPFILFSIVKSKFPWYVWGTYPLMCILAGYGFSLLYNKVLMLPKIRTALLIIVICCISIFSFKNIKMIAKVHTDNVPADHIQVLLSRNEKYNMKTVYFWDKKTKGNWPQSSFLAIELYGDMIGEHGGIDAFIKNKNSYLIINKEELSNLKFEYDICNQTSNFVLIKQK
ncbi:glycosyltransferase family 39 protein [Phascolarctobacterium sp. ET69]|uniref:ArnT family glycosyltransferase n=1 Tax=Phascolarctobacterium sp. ET69 TaxID=2939420 RepID=UPI0020113DEE|nr:glycosyltransferase family 39 protein [Phascolarctobacterium sp. ET69]MCL1605151.1 glycosyltransferase family 39 protein [Phascolarctobacterium sp. ET69]